MSRRIGIALRQCACILGFVLWLAAGSGKAFGAMSRLGEVASPAFPLQASAEEAIRLELGKRILCGNDPVNRHDPLGLEDLRPDQMNAALAAISGTFTYGGKGIRLGRTYSSLEEIRSAFRSTYMTGALQGMPFDLSSQRVEASDAADQLWVASSCSLQAAWESQQAAQRAAACAMDRRNEAHQQFFSSYPKVLGLTWSMVGAEVLNVGANPLGFGVSTDWEYDFSNGKSGVGLRTHEVSGTQQAMAIGMFILPEVRMAKSATNPWVMGTYRELSALTAGENHLLEAHKILEGRHLRVWGHDIAEAPAVLLSQAEHQAITGVLQGLLPVGIPYTRAEVWKAYKKAYREVPEWLDAIRHYFQ